MSLTIKDIDRLRYRPTKATEEFLSDIRTGLGIADKATVARLAIARSLDEATAPQEGPQVEGEAEKGLAIEGIHLFGDDADVWATLVAHSFPERIESSARFRELVEFHWNRGARLFAKDLQEVNRNFVDFVVRLAGRVLESRNASVNGRVQKISVTSAPVRTPVRIQILENQPSWQLNASGGNGLMVISGRPGSGKSQLALDMLTQASRQGVRFLFFDLKGEFEPGDPGTQQDAMRKRFLNDTGADYIRLISATLPINPFFRGENSAETAQISAELANLARCFASQLGANQERIVREAYEGLDSPDIGGLVDSLKSRGEDGVAFSIFDKISSFRIFQSADESVPLEAWLSQSRIIDLKGLGADTETKSLVVAFILNAIMRKLNRQLPVENGVQPLQMILFVDEAHLLLPKEGKAGLLGSLARQGRSWGFPVWLASQDADAFVTTGQHATDFSELSDCGVHLSPSSLTESQQRKILGQVLYKQLAVGEGVMRLKSASSTGRIRQYWKHAGEVTQDEIQPIS